MTLLKSPSPISTISPALILALRKILNPLIKLLLSKGVTYNYLIDIIKEEFVRVADKEFSGVKGSTTDSYLSMLTGVHRKDIKRLRPGINETLEVVPESVSTGARLVSKWASEDCFLDEDNRPKPIPRYIKEGGDISFEGLVASMSKDIRSRVVLDECLRLGVVYINENKQICLNTDAFIPTKGFEEKAFFFGHNLHDHTAAAASNMLDENHSFLERSVYYDKLSENSIKALAEQSELLGMKTLLAINKKAMTLEKEDQYSNKSSHRMTFGIYFFSEAVVETDDLEKKKVLKKSIQKPK